MQIGDRSDRHFGIFSGEWIPVSLSSDIVSEPCRVEVLNLAVALWRNAIGQVCAVEDRCPHRGARLSDGIVYDQQIECPYHGWRFTSEGICIHIPAPEAFENCAKTAVLAFSASECAGIVWLSVNPLPKRRIVSIVGEGWIPTYAFTDTVRANVFDVAENLLEISHFPFVHESTFSSRQSITSLDNVQISITEFGFECKYSVPIKAKGVFAHLCPVGTTVVNVTSLFIKPFTQLFDVEYDSGLSYRSIQALCPGSDSPTKLFQVGLARSTGDAARTHALKQADFAIWQEDKVMLESLQVAPLAKDWYKLVTPPIRVPPIGLRREIVRAMGFHV